MTEVLVIGVAIAGALCGALFALIPGLHIYNIAGLALLLASGHVLPITDEVLAFLLVGLVVGWSIVCVVPSVFLYAPDDAHAFIVLPATRMLLTGRGMEAALSIGAGSLGALLALVLISPILGELLRPLRVIVQPHIGWILVAITGFLILSEWPRGDDRAPTPLRRLLSAWAYLGAGLLTFILSGILGMVLLNRSPIAVTDSFANLLPAFVGLFTVPGMIQVLAFGQQPPTQAQTGFNLPPRLLIRGTLTGVAGGLFAGFLPVISGGVGGLLAGHASAQRDDRLFLVSQGASKVSYYIGSLMLLFVPGLTLTRGGMSWMLSSMYIPYGWHIYWLTVAAIALGGGLAFVVLFLTTRTAARITGRLNCQVIAAGSLAAALLVTFAFTGLSGLAVMSVATMIGLIPILIGGRRMNCLGVLLLPMTLSFIGYGPLAAKWLGLL